MKKIAIPFRMENDLYQIKQRYSRYFASYHFLPCFICKENIELLYACDAVCLPGGGDLDPSYYGQTNTNSDVNKENDTLDMEVLRIAEKIHLPIFGICRGLQCINVFYGGNLKQHIPHHQNERHLVSYLENGQIKKQEITNSYHHQCIDQVAPHFSILLQSEDQIVEGIINQEKRILAVQYHPEIEDPFHIFSFFTSLWLKDID